MSMIFEFRLMEKAEEFVRETKKRYGLNGQAFDDGDEASEHTPFPWALYPPVHRPRLAVWLQRGRD